MFWKCLVLYVQDSYGSTHKCVFIVVSGILHILIVQNIVENYEYHAGNTAWEWELMKLHTHLAEPKQVEGGVYSNNNGQQDSSKFIYQ